MLIHIGGNNCSHGFATYVWSGSINIPAYNPYTPNTYSLNSVTPIARRGNDFIVNYSIYGGTNGLDWKNTKLYSSSDVLMANYRMRNDSDKKTGRGQNMTHDFNPGTNGNGNTHNQVVGNKVSNFDSLWVDGGKFKVSVRFSDNYAEYETGKKTIYTYQKPSLSGVTLKNSSPTNAITDNSFILSGINNRAWSSYENPFTTFYNKDNGSWVDITNSVTTSGSTVTWALTAANLRNLIPKSKDNTDVTFYFKRRNTSASNWDSDTKSVKLKLYYRPRQQTTSSQVKYKLNSSSGTTISKGQVITNTSSLTGIYVDWSGYDNTAVNAGWTQGYRLRLYNNSGSIVKTYYTTNKYYIIPKDDIPRIYGTKIDITPYYGNDQPSMASESYASNYWYYNLTTITQYDFISLVTELDKPVIDYPVANSTWVNHNFRICLTLPNDPDYSYVTGTYTYENIELKINNQIFRISDATGTSTGSILKPEIFSALPTNLTHKRAIVIYPNYGSILTTSASYSIQIRVKKRYGITSTENRWSSWSDIRTFKVTIPTYNVNVEDLILASHFNDARTTVNNIQNTYAVGWSNIPNPAIAGSTIITADQYSQQNLMVKLNETKNKVNNYCTFDSGRDYIKIDKNDNLPTTFPENKQGLYITADKETNTIYKEDASVSSAKPGRNYWKYLYDRILLLK